jgi:hypothetical protein
MPNPTLQTVLFVSAFALAYLFLVLRNTLAGRCDLYDLIMLSMVAIFPAAFTLFPSLAAAIARVIGVSFPFIAMFGALFLVVFVFMHSMTARLHRLERQNSTLVQELGLLALALEQARTEPRSD